MVNQVHFCQIIFDSNLGCLVVKAKSLLIEENQFKIEKMLDDTVLLHYHIIYSKSVFRKIDSF